MYEVLFKSSFLKRLKQLEANVFELAVKKIELIKNQANHKSLKVHKLHGALSEWHSFSVNYKIRIIFRFEGKRIILLGIDDHDIYKNH